MEAFLFSLCKKLLSRGVFKDMQAGERVREAGSTCRRRETSSPTEGYWTMKPRREGTLEAKSKA